MTDGRRQIDHEYVERHAVLARYRTHELDEPDAEAFEIHFLECAICRARLQADDALAEGLRASQEGLGEAVRRSPAWLQSYAIAATVLLAVAVGALFWRGATPTSVASAQVIPLLAQRAPDGNTTVAIRIEDPQEMLVLLVDAVQPELKDYDVSITDPSGRLVWVAKNLAPRLTLNAERLVVPVRATALDSSDLVLTVTAKRADGTVQPAARFALRITHP